MAIDYFTQRVLDNIRPAYLNTSLAPNQNEYLFQDRLIDNLPLIRRDSTVDLGQGYFTLGMRGTGNDPGTFGSVNFNVGLLQPGFTGTSNTIDWNRANYEFLYAPGTTSGNEAPLSTNTSAWGDGSPLSYYDYRLMLEQRRLNMYFSSPASMNNAAYGRGQEQGYGFFYDDKKVTEYGNQFGTPFGHNSLYKNTRDYTISEYDSGRAFPVVDFKPGTTGRFDNPIKNTTSASWNGFGALPEGWNSYKDLATGDIKPLPWGTRREPAMTDQTFGDRHAPGIYSGSMGGGARFDPMKSLSTYTNPKNGLTVYEARFSGMDYLNSGGGGISGPTYSSGWSTTGGQTTRGTGIINTGWKNTNPTGLSFKSYGML